MLVPLFMTVILLLLCAISLSIGAIQATCNADAILPVIISLQHWTPFYWGQDRYGMLIPLLAIPFKSPIVNFAIQNILSFFLGMLAPLVIARYLYGRFEGYTIGLIALIFFVGLYPANSIQEYFGVAQPYGTALALCYTGMILLSTERHLGVIKQRIANTLGGLLIVAAFWVTPSLIFTAFPISVLIGMYQFEDLLSPEHTSFKQKFINRLSLYIKSKYFFVSIVILLAFLVSLILSKTSQFGAVSKYGFLPADQWLTCWNSFLMSFIQMDLPTTTIRILFTIASITALLFCIFSKNAALRKVLIIIIVAVCCEFFTLGTIEWIKLNNFFGRYLLTSLFLLLVGLSGSIFIGLTHNHFKKTSPWFPLVTASVLLMIVLVRFGSPSWQTMRASLKDNFGQNTQAVIDNQCTHFIGDYSAVWSTVFDVNRVLYEQNKPDTLWGITYRSENTIPLWKDQLNTNTCIASARRDKSVQQILTHFNIKGRRLINSDRRIAIYQYIEENKTDKNQVNPK
jgi:hypothetical protein